MIANPLDGPIAFAGGGFMGSAMIQGLLARELVTPRQIGVFERLPDRRDDLAGRFGVSATDDPCAALAGARLVVLAVKPQDFAALADEIRPVLTADQVLLSIMAGVTLTSLRGALGVDRIARAMPNTPGAIGEGFTGWTGSAELRESAGAAIEAALDALGKHAYFGDEKYLDMVTAVSGSGPGYVMLMVEALIDAAVLVGLPRDVAREMVLQTVAGSARWAQQSGVHPAALRDTVTSPGGTTAAGLQRLEEAGVRAAFASAVVAAFERGRALGG